VTKINPFKPNSPVPTGMFAGRIDEILALQQGLRQTRSGHCAHFLITGERGIGKSSLLFLINPMAKGEITSLDGETFGFIAITCVISKFTSLPSLVKMIDRLLKRELNGIERIRSFLDTTWEFAQRVKIMDSGIDKGGSTEEVDLVIDDLAYSLSETCKRICNASKSGDSKQGIVIFIDEADNACDELHLGYFLKVVTEKLQQNQCDNIMFVVAGLPDVVEKLSESHESSIRIFTQLNIKELSTTDRIYVIDKGIAEGNKINKEQVEMDANAKNTIATLSEGYPHFIQQFSHSAFDHNVNGVIHRKTFQ